MLVISKPSNNSFQDKSPKEKIELLKDPKHSGTLCYIRDFIDKYGEKAKSWGENEIMERAYDIAKDSYSRIWRIEKDFPNA